jgi:uncharacterized protein YjbI with pentapeptide repeats/energy-coupling factor transporter ATP-binding protein EcfA2
MIQPERAPVRPRVLSPHSGEALLLEDEARRLAEAGGHRVMLVVGPTGSGKTTALHHLAAVLPPQAGVLLLDEPGLPDLLSAAAAQGLVVCTRSAVCGLLPLLPILSTYRLAPWDRDDLIEYLLADHGPACAGVVARVGSGDRSLLGGLPALWRPVLDRLAGDPTLPDARRAFHRYIEEHLSDTDLLERARSACLNVMVVPEADPTATLLALARPGFAESLIRILGHPAVRLVLAAERVAADLHGEGACDYLAARLPRELVKAVGTLIAPDAQALAHLRALLAGPAWSHAMSVSLLHATGTRLCLRAICLLAANAPRHLAGAYLENAYWPGVDLAGANLAEADLTEAHLRKANLTRATAHRAVLRRVRLRGALLDEVDFYLADLGHADLAQAVGPWARFDSANLEEADLSGARLVGASFTEANLAGTVLRDVNLAGATFTGAELEGADFSGADLTGAVLAGLCLRTARWDGATFIRAQLPGCDLEYLALPGADFRLADLGEALLTGSAMSGANFEGACLRQAGLADVEWEGASLRGADLRGASFHMGSCRSGLVGSPIPCEGSRTGFYTDDYDEQTYKAPEEIRKANLCGADLRDALLDGVDFYLVDLRGALYDPEQEVYLRRSGAILEARV